MRERMTRRRVIGVVAVLPAAATLGGSVALQLARKAADAATAAGLPLRRRRPGEGHARIVRGGARRAGARCDLQLSILASQFASFTQPLAIMASVPFWLIGVFLALLLTGTTLNIFSIIGFIMLMRLVTKLAILLVDYANRARR